MTGHIDDGGTDIQVLLNNQTICDSTATYAATSVYVDPKGDLDKEHISNMTTCYNPVNVKKGDLLNVRAVYDTDMYPPMVYPNNQTEALPVIGIAMAYIANASASTGATASSKPVASSTGAMLMPTSGAAVLSRGVGLAVTVVIAGIASLC